MSAGGVLFGVTAVSIHDATDSMTPATVVTHALP